MWISSCFASKMRLYRFTMVWNSCLRKAGAKFIVESALRKQKMQLSMISWLRRYYHSCTTHLVLCSGCQSRWSLNDSTEGCFCTSRRRTDCRDTTQRSGCSPYPSCSPAGRETRALFPNTSLPVSIHQKQLQTNTWSSVPVAILLRIHAHSNCTFGWFDFTPSTRMGMIFSEMIVSMGKSFPTR